MVNGKQAARAALPGRAPPAGASLRVVDGFYEGLEVPVDRDWLVIGRGRSADLMLADPTVSRAHAAIGFDGGRFFLQDLGSTNGTWRNGVACHREPLADGDRIQLGAIPLRVRLALHAGHGSE